MWLAALVLSGGLVYWMGLITNQRAVLGAGFGALLLSLLVMLNGDGIDPLALPVLLAAGLLIFGLKHYPAPLWQVVGWTLFVVLVLALGFRVFPFFAPIDTIQTVEQAFGFPPEKVVLMLLVPTMVLVPWFARKAEGNIAQSDARSWLIALAVLAGILVVVIPIALVTGFIKPGWATQSATYLVYWLAYNLIYTCILEESFFRGIVQTALIRRFAGVFPPTGAQAAGIAVAALLFGLVHFGGGWMYVILATIAGVGYGLAYELTGRLHFAVLVHFSVNAIHRVAFAGI